MLYNRDISWLQFNLRVLQEAADETVPLSDRLKFLSIFSSNLDEFFRVRYPQVVALSQLNKKIQLKTSVTEDIAAKVHAEIFNQLEQFGYILKQQIIPCLEANKIIFYYNKPILDQHLSEIREFFLSEILSFIQLIFLEGNAQQEFLPENNKLYFIVRLSYDGSAVLKYAIVNIPSDKLPRFFVLSPVENFNYVIFLDDIIRENLHRLFPEMQIESCYSIKFNRDAELDLQNEYSGNLLQKMEKQLRKRELGAPSRFIYERGMPKNMQLFLASEFNLQFDEMFAGDRYHNLKDLASFPVFDKALSYDKQKPIALSFLKDSGNIFELLKKQDILLHIPYNSYNPVLAFFNQAAIDPAVSEIYITLYRVAAESHIVNALISAAKNGKHVMAFIEIKARFDEENNIRWSRLMKKAGVKIIYSLPGIKVHSKTALVIKKSPDKHNSYAILSTGNFNETTAKFYTDHVLMTTDKSITLELLQLFNFLRNNNEEAKKNIEFNRLLVSQFNMINEFEKLINEEIKKAEDGNDAFIRIKVNNLEEPYMIKLLYKASEAGVKIHLLVRSICCLVPQMEGLSENIIVRRLVDRYLEHSRIFIFGNDEDAKIYIGSADWMTRNLHHRIEVCVGISSEVQRRQLIKYFEWQWSDTDKLVQLFPGLQQHKIENTNEKKINAQQNIYNYLLQQS
ncbi:MAG: polyphosphate kinase 1 [Parafilimonas sp.]|nr:polyphosphate kinase 1 [Parafilimonas sp.]